MQPRGRGEAIGLRLGRLVATPERQRHGVLHGGRKIAAQARDLVRSHAVDERIAEVEGRPER